MTGGDDGGGVADGETLLRLAEALVGRDAVGLSAARDAIAAALGPAALVDAAAVAALFDAIDRVADATGIPLEGWKAEESADFRSAIGIDAFAAAQEKGST